MIQLILYYMYIYTNSHTILFLEPFFSSDLRKNKVVSSVNGNKARLCYSMILRLAQISEKIVNYYWDQTPKCRQKIAT